MEVVEKDFTEKTYNSKKSFVGAIPCLTKDNDS